jgi:hypothetical protein
MILTNMCCYLGLLADTNVYILYRVSGDMLIFQDLIPWFIYSQNFHVNMGPVLTVMKL